MSAPAPHRVVLSYGAFDLFTPGQAEFLRRARALGDELIIGCATNALCAQMGRHTFMGHDERRALLEHCRYVDRVIAQDSLTQEHVDIVNYNVSIVALGHDQTRNIDALAEIAQVVFLPRPRFIPQAAWSEDLDRAV